MRRATVRTSHDDPGTVAAAVRPDNTAEMETAVRDGRVVTTVERETTAGLRSTVDDYVVNLRVADRTASGGDGAPEDGDGSPVGSGAAPEDGDAAPEDGDAAPEDGDAAPEDGDAPPEDGDAAPDERDADGSDLGEQPDDRPNEDGFDDRPHDPNHE